MPPESRKIGELWRGPLHQVAGEAIFGDAGPITLPCLIWKEASEHSKEWQAEQQRIHDEANAARSEKSKTQQKRGNQYTKPEEVEERPQPVDEPAKVAPRGQGSQAKAEASNTNRGAVERGDRLAKDRRRKRLYLGTNKPTDHSRRRNLM